MNDINEARRLFLNAGLAFPTIPEELAMRLQKRERWVFSTRMVEVWPYDLSYYICEFDGSHVEDYVIISGSGHGVNSYAVQYYIVCGSLGMFLHLGWDGVYMDNQLEAIKIRDCFSLADKIVLLARNNVRFKKGERLTVVASDFYGSYWTLSGGRPQKKEGESRGLVVVLNEVLLWLGSSN